MTIKSPDLGAGLRLHLNENTGGCSPKVVEAVRGFTAERLALYPDFKDAVLETAAFLGVDSDRIVLTNGLDEGILLASIACLVPRAPRALVELGAPDIVPSGTPEVVVSLPTFDPYLHAARAMGARIVSVPATPDYSFPVDAVLRAITPNTRLVYVNNPNNPTGQPIPKEAIRRVARAAGHALVMVDEAYHDFLGEHFLEEAADYPNVMIGRTFSKAFGLAGMRAGCSWIASPVMLEPVRRAMPIFNLNVVALAALRAAIADPEFRAWYVSEAATSKRLVYAACDRLGLRYWPSAANFVLIDGKARAQAIVAGSASAAFVRDRSADPSCPNCFRLTAGVVAHTEQAVDALEAVCAAR